MSYSLFGQTTSHNVLVPGTSGQMTVIPGAQFVPNYTGPGQPYKMQITNQQVENAVYSKLETQAQEVAPPSANPQVVYKMEDGLEVPAYILERTKERNQIEQAKAEALASVKPPMFHNIGLFASQNPGIATLAALAVGSVMAHLYFNKKSGE